MKTLGVRSTTVVLAAMLGTLALPSVAQDGSTEVKLVDSEGEQVGTATFSETESGVAIELNVSGLKPGEHGLHIHAKGVCDSPDFQSSGPHFDPGEARHGFLHSEGPHAGDLPMLVVGSEGESKDYKFTTNRVALNSDSLRDSDGSSLIVHADPDDYLTDPGGKSGNRVVCGVISESEGGD